MQKIKLYCITCPRTDISYEEQAEQACIGGADAVEFLAEGMSTLSMIETGQKIKAICRTHNVLFFVRERADIAVAVDADGVHLSQEDIPVEFVRQIIGPRKLIGISACTLGQALAAAEAGANFLLIGPIYISSGKDPSCGVDIIRLIRKRVKIPVLAAGGIQLDNLGEVIRTGADGIGVASAVCKSLSVQNAAHEFKQLVLKTFEEQARLNQK